MNSIYLVGNKCCGCHSCEYSCPHNAIEFFESQEGFCYPQIDDNKCIGCGICLKRCPISNVMVNKSKQIGYAAYINDKRVLRTSSSGGIFYALAKNIIDTGGVVFGCSFDGKNVRHQVATMIHELSSLKGSKYVESDTAGVYPLVQRYLDNNQNVLFTGTPCQIAGLKLFLNKDYENLFMVDIICHGVPSRKLFRLYIKWMEEKNKAKLLTYSFRNKEKNDWSLTYKAELKKNNGKNKTIEAIASIDPYYYAFLQGRTYRESCYQCPYSQSSRPGDITLGDFWGIEKILPEMDYVNGVSAVIVNNEKGNYLFNSIKEKLTYQNVALESIVNNNGNLRTPSKRPSERESIYTCLESRGFSIAAKCYMSNSRIVIEQVRNLFSNRFRQKVKKLIKLIKH